MITCLNTWTQIYDPAEVPAAKPARRREPIIPWYLSNPSNGPSVDTQVSGWDQSSDFTPRKPVVVNDGAHAYRPQDQSINGQIEQQSVTHFQDYNEQNQWSNFEQGQHFDQNTDQNYQENWWLVSGDDNHMPYEEFAIESKVNI